MISALILASALAGQINASDGPPREWFKAHLNGNIVDIWGWRDGKGGIAHRYHENYHLYPQFAPKTVAKPAVVLPKPLGAGMVLESNGTINNGLQLQQTHPTGIVDTNDPDLGSKLKINDRCPNEPDEPTPDPFDPDAPAKPNISWGWVAAAVAFMFIVVTWDREPK